MLIEFSVKNHRSIREKQTFSMVAGDDVDRARPHRAVDTGFDIAPQVLTSACIVGPNGAGKSSLANAMQFMSRFASYFYPREDYGDIKVKPFAFHTEWKEIPSEFEIKFIQNNTVYQYGFSLTAERVEEEWLFSKSKNSNAEQTIFTRFYDRESNNYNWNLSGIALESERDLLKSHTRHESLFLSTSVNLNMKNDLEQAHRWITTRFSLHTNTYFPFVRDGAEKFDDGSCKNRVIKFLQHLGVYFDDIIVVEPEMNQDKDAGKTFPKLPSRYYAVRNNNMMTPIYLDLLDESTGTVQLFNLALPIIEALDHGVTLFADDINFGLHPIAFERLVSLFYNPAVNRNGAQLIFTTHDIATIDHARLDRDQIWLTRKNDELATELYPYSNFDTSKQRTFTNGYLNGRYGAVPRPPRAWQ